MMDSEQKKRVLDRLKRIEGQVSGLQRMVEEDRYCVDVLTQIASVVSALYGVEDRVMTQHLETCVADAMRSGDQREQQKKIEEVRMIISKFRRHG